MHSGSAHENQRFDRFKKLLKIITYIFVFVIVLIGAIGSKMSYLLMVTFVSNGQRVKFCDAKRERNAQFKLSTLLLVKEIYVGIENVRFRAGS